MRLRIGPREIGDGCPCFIVAEAGLNHNGQPALARRLVRLALECGADAVKFQKRSTLDLLCREARLAPYQSPFGATYGQHREALELAETDWRGLKEDTDRAGLLFFASPWDLPSLGFLVGLGVPALKVASACLSDVDLLDAMARTGLPMLVSTGMHELAEIDQAVAIIRRHHERFVLLQCTSRYPSDNDQLHLRTIPAFRERYGGLVGFSGHERGLAPSVAAVALGACVVERHLTHDRTAPGPDHAASLEPAGFTRLVRDIRNVEAALGSPAKHLLDCEGPVRARLAKSLCTTRPLRRGERIAPEALCAKGPGTGLPPASKPEVVGRVAQADVDADCLLPTDALGWPR